MRPSPKMFTDTLTIVTPGTTTDEFDNPEPDWSTATRTTVRARISQRGTSEVSDGRDAQVSEWKVYLPAGTTITGECRVEIGDSVLEVIGPPYTPTTGISGTVGHIEARLQLVEG